MCCKPWSDVSSLRSYRSIPLAIRQESAYQVYSTCCGILIPRSTSACLMVLCKSTGLCLGTWLLTLFIKFTFHTDLQLQTTYLGLWVWWPYFTFAMDESQSTTSDHFQSVTTQSPLDHLLPPHSACASSFCNPLVILISVIFLLPCLWDQLQTQCPCSSTHQYNFLFCLTTACLISVLWWLECYSTQQFGE